ncbi:hypothetical protein CHLNCDRAFT_143307 [Chlorella variabilis]|uniref:Protein kinase domain-containing protein n=1 Tax=Chlorella variabilis TaxID=554065 RepID=E1Z9X7_CHLVA|nr:hypothetical protein CHLNCDRAFT_143307 [Chlorella variabilis]EFN57850.1 hypothetical protein CHLNCDRAFT_143307 [Chlorella variabilis]|eukprot:XP_005849952.1 hypothetical protein CHLNCDRAFT_143307 [Chlorella variabilis]
MARGQACLSGALACILLACAASPAAAQPQQTGLDPLEALLPELRTATDVWSAAELLAALNETSGSTQGQLITLQDDIYIRPDDLLAFQGSLPINGGNRTVVLRGGKAGASREGASACTLDWGEVVDLLFHPAGHSFYAYNLILQARTAGMAPSAAGYAAGLGTQMVAGVFWPTTTGEPGHLMGFWSSVIRVVSPSCGQNSTSFAVRALQQLLRRNDTVRQLDAQSYYVGQQLNGSYAVRVLPTGDTGTYSGNIRWSWDNTVVTCTRPRPVTTSPPAPSTSAEAALLASRHNATAGIAATADELLALLATPDISRIILGAHISLGAAHGQGTFLPIVLQGRHLIVESNDEAPKVLDLGACPSLLYLSADSTLTFSRVILQGAAPPSSVIANRSSVIVGSPLWPTVDGAEGHQLLMLNCTITSYVTPCSRNSTQLTVELLRKVLGQDGVQSMGDTSYSILPRFRQAAPIRSMLGEQVGSTPYTYESVVIQCVEDPGLGLAAELLQRQALTNTSAPAAVSSDNGSSSSSGGGGGTAWVPIVIAVTAAVALAAAAAGAVLVWRRGRRRKQRIEAVRLAPAVPLTSRGAKMDRMESGDLDDACNKLGTDASACPTPSPPRTSDERPSADDGKPAGASAPLTPERGLRLAGPCPQHTLFGVVEGLEIAELLGRGGYGKVYKGRWNGAIVAVKVVEHRVAAGTDGSLSREPLLCMSVSHPNCITTYKLSVIRLLRGEDLLEEQSSSESLPPTGCLSNNSGRTDDSAMASGANKGGRRVRSLLSGAEAVEVEDPYGQLQPGLYETWIYCDRGTLVEALDEKKLRLPDGSPNMVPVYLCLLDIASGMQYLHSLGIMHSDLKPANVLLKGARNSKRGFICKLADFGLSRMLDGCATHVETGSLGTPTHAAPELLREGHLSPAADVFAFGVLAWELAAGEEAYRGMHPIWVTQQGTRPPPLPDCPPPLAQLMQRCWEEEPADRQVGSAGPKLQEQLAAERQARQLQQQPGLSSTTTSDLEGVSSSTLPTIEEITSQDS